MEDRIFCPECSTPLSRSPKKKVKFSNGRACCFSHRSAYRDIECSLRTPLADGKYYASEEDAKRAIENDELAIISSFMTDRPEIIGGPSEPYDQSAVEDLDGPMSSVPIARHRGENFKLPSRITTVAGLCRNFDKNLHKYFVFPNASAPQKLVSVLTDIETVTEPCETPHLYYGKIVQSTNAGRIPTPTNIRMTKLRYPRGKWIDFNIKIQAAKQEEKGINDNSAGRIVLFWGKITESGIGLAVKGLGWGEFSLLPEKYNKLLFNE
ncbi:hypothetical protein EIL82_24145 [Pandoraea apista]|uniref:Uncharacterized protein n=2 Tax=Pandoraea apista TaxID=93218 RepID=A0ABX9ZHZ4_9BURK|nr:hypothetical protein C7830_24880 [Pandoraea apista]RRJ25333.1 hypothetical protein EIB05_24265 [Pandoraea apista]RRJ72207.1 hypothetical protein EIL82_24145 [Pandoraea apista]RSD08320.1 hypothetical protein EIZ52_24605 [Pandoraea apista]RSK73850.1 hypothetical protein EJE83_25260 [Pandoraea apista]